MQGNGNLVSTLLLPMLPLVVFIVVETVYGTEIGLIAALILGFLELVYTYVKHRKFDKFIVLDIALLTALGGISIVLENDIFFLMKPAIFELIFAAILGISIFSDKNILFLMMKRYIKQDNPMIEKQIKEMSKYLFFIFILHAIAIVISALFFSHTVWVFVSTTLLYILMGLFFVFTFVKKKFFTEMLPLVDKEGNILGKAPRDYCHQLKEPYHPVVHLMVTNSDGEYLLQKRAPKKTFPNMWDSSVGGHISFGEEVDVALKREAKEEINIKDFDYQFLGKLVQDLEVGPEIIYLFHAKVNGVSDVKNREVSEVKYFSLHDIAEMDDTTYTVHLIDEIEMVEKYLKG